MRKKSKLVYVVGVNDADYNVTENALVDGKWKIVWICSFYSTWRDMLKR